MAGLGHSTFTRSQTMTLEQALQTIDEAIGKVSLLRGLPPYGAAHFEFVQTTGLELGRIFGPDSAVCLNFTNIDYSSVGSFYGHPSTYEEEIVKRRHATYLRGLEMAAGILESARGQLQRHGVDRILTASRIRAGGPRVFISHGTETKALTKVELYLRASGAQPIVVMREPSEGLAVDDLVEKRLSESDCAVILATADEEVAGRRQPRPNVIHEIGLAQQKLGEKIIYLKEVGCDFPSNVQPKVWENFTQDNMENAFMKITKELHAFGYT